MFNPAYSFNAELLESFIKNEVFYFVKSTYLRGENDKKKAYLISHYHNLAEAERHFNAIPQDQHRQIYDLRKDADLQALRSETTAGDNYHVFSKLIHPDNEKIATEKYRENTKRYLFNNTNWDLKGSITIYPKIYFQLGELYVRLAHQRDIVTIKFAELENS